MMNELMTFAGETKFKFERCDPADLVHATSRLVAGTLPPNVTINYDLPEGLPAVDADPNQFWKVFFNLVKNAAEALEDGPGTITIAAKPFEMTPSLATTFTTSRTVRTETGVMFTVSDTGPGIPPDVLRRIFDPYVSTKTTAGHGLGLAIVASIVTAHSGMISVRSTTVNGTTFSIFLPDAKIPVNTPSSSAVQNTSNVTGDVLVVDDDEAILKTISILLKALNLEPHIARDPDSALSEFRRFSANLSCVILDAHLGNFDVVRLLRSFRIADPHVPVVIASGSTENEAAEMFKSQPYNGFLAKPYTLAELRDVLNQCAQPMETPKA